MRAGLPAIPRVIRDPDGAQPQVIAAFAVDGIASPTILDGGYAARGPVGLLGGTDIYAVILADVVDESLVLARNGDGPGLYYARHGEGWVVASEPTVLIAAGVPRDPDVEVIRRFIATGACDDSERTFFASIWRVLPDEVVELTAGGGVVTHRADPTAPTNSIAGVLQAAVAGGRVSLLLGPGMAGAAVLGMALAQPDRVRPLPVHTAIFPSLESAASHTPAALVPMKFGTVRHTGHAFEVTALDLDTFLRDLGEPVPDLETYLLWAVAQRLGDGIDTMVDSTVGGPGAVARLADRVSARYGVVVRCPLREDGLARHTRDAELELVVSRTLPGTVGRYASRDSARPVSATEVLLALRGSVAAALATPRPWADRAASVDSLRRLHAGQTVDAGALLRAYLVERWLHVIDGRDATGEIVRENIAVRGGTWARIPVHTDVLAPGEHAAAATAWFVKNAITDLCVDESYEDALRGPWFAILSGKVVSVCQRRVRPLWEIQTGSVARGLAGLARRRLPRLGEGWTMQVAIDEAGMVRVAAGVLAAMVREEWGVRLLPSSVLTLFPPRVGAVAPADGAVVRGPLQADDTAQALVDALRYSLPPHLVATLAGCAVVSADESGSQVLGFAPGPGPGRNDLSRPESLIAQLCADNPAGQRGECTPVVLAFAAPRVDAVLDDLWEDRLVTETPAG
jgi:hypothetical protein